MTHPEPFPDGATFSDTLDPAMEITDPSEADAYFERLVAHMMRFGKTREQAEAGCRESLGYWAGYYSNETRERVERLFRCEHPVFGSIARRGAPTPEQAVAMGQEMAERWKQTP